MTSPYAEALTDIGEGLTVRWNAANATLASHLLVSELESGATIGRVFSDDEAEAWAELPERVANYLADVAAAEEAAAVEEEDRTEEITTAKDQAIADILGRSSTPSAPDAEAKAKAEADAAAAKAKAEADAAKAKAEAARNQTEGS